MSTARKGFIYLSCKTIKNVWNKFWANICQRIICLRNKLRLFGMTKVTIENDFEKGRAVGTHRNYLSFGNKLSVVKTH